MTTIFDDQDRQALDLQVQLDPVYQAVLNKRAPQIVGGEPLALYQRRVLAPLKNCHPQWRNCDLGKLGSDVLKIASRDICDAALKEAKNCRQGTPLRMVKEKDQTGREITRFYGDISQFTDTFRMPCKQLVGVKGKPK